MPLEASSSIFMITMTLRGHAGTTLISEAQSDGWQAPHPHVEGPPPQPELLPLLPQLHLWGELVDEKAPVSPHLF